MAPTLPAAPDWQAFDALHDDPTAWREAIVALALEHGARNAAEVQQESEGSVLVARIGRERVIKLYPPFLLDHFQFERAMLLALHGRLSVPTPELLFDGERAGWPYLVMTQMRGEPLTQSWPRFTEAERCSLLGALGALTGEVHALPVGSLATLAPRWEDFIATQRAHCAHRQQRTGLPAHLLQQLGAFLEGPLPAGPAVLLTGEYTPFNLFTQGAGLSAMFDFGDGLVGPREYDWLGPLCFLAAGHAPRCAAFLRGCGAELTPALRTTLLRQLLLHRYSNLPAQLKCDGWREAGSFEALAERLWPLAP